MTSLDSKPAFETAWAKGRAMLRNCLMWAGLSYLCSGPKHRAKETGADTHGWLPVMSARARDGRASGKRLNKTARLIDEADRARRIVRTDSYVGMARKQDRTYSFWA